MRATFHFGLLSVLLFGIAEAAWAQIASEETIAESSPKAEQTLNWEKYMGEESPFAKIARGVIAERYKTDPAYRIEMFDAARAEHHDGDGKRAIAIFTSLAEQANHTPSMRWLGRMAYGGEAQKQDKALAFKWFERAALAGDVDAMMQTGGAAYTGQGVEQSYTTARHWFLNAADRGSNKVDAELFKMFEEGLGGAADPEMAMVFAKRLAASFKPQGLYYMGVAYRDGDRVKQDFEKARFKLEWAQEENHPDAEAALEKLSAMEKSLKIERDTEE